MPHLDEPSCVLDPGCGDGAIGEVVKATWPGALALGTEIDNALAQAARRAFIYDTVYTVDYLAPSEGRLSADTLIIGNPPYSLAMEFVRRSFELIAETGGCGQVCFLLRLPWLAGQKRAQFHREHPADVFVLPKRPSFTGGGTDSCDYSWFRWSLNASGRVAGGGTWRVL